MSNGLTKETIIKLCILLAIYMFTHINSLIRVPTFFKWSKQCIHLERCTFCPKGEIAVIYTRYYNPLNYYIKEVLVNENPRLLYSSRSVNYNTVIIEYLDNLVCKELPEVSFSIQTFERNITISTNSKDGCSSVNAFISEITLKAANASAIDKALAYLLELYTTDVLKKRKPGSRVHIITHANSLQYYSMEFHTTKTFENLFFEQKPNLIEKLDFFMNEKKIYDLTGMPHTLGILMHGIPGSGKTSTIKAIAKYTKRDILKISPKHIDSINDLYKIFCTSASEAMVGNFNLKDVILVFEEVDCGLWGDIFKSRALLKDDEKYEEDVIKKFLDRYSDMHTNNNEMLTKVNSAAYNKITLGDFLEFIDGLVEQEGRIVIMTTNHVEKLDKALLRPGRIDMQINFGELLKKDVNSLYEIWFGESIPLQIYEQMHDYIYTQAEIGQIFTTNNLDYIHNQLASNSCL